MHEDSELPPELPPDMVERLQATRSAIEDENWLAEVVNWQDKHGFGLDLDPVYAIQNEYMRAEAIYELGLLLDSQFHPKEGFNDLLDATYEIENENSRDRALSGIASGMAGASLSDSAMLALETLMKIQNAQTRTEVASDVVERLAISSSECEDVIDAAESLIEDKKEKSRFVCAFLSEWWDIEEALAAALSIEEHQLRSEAISALAPSLEEPFLRQVLTSISINNDSGALADVISQFASYPEGKIPFTVRDHPNVVPDKLSTSTTVRLTGKMLQEALDSAQTIEDWDERATAISQLIPELSKLPRKRLYRLLGSALRILAARSRPQFLRDLSVFAPVINMLGGHEAMDEVCRAIQDVECWWP